MYRDERIVADRTVDSHIKKLRRKLADVVPGEEFIHSSTASVITTRIDAERFPPCTMHRKGGSPDEIRESHAALLLGCCPDDFSGSGRRSRRPATVPALEGYVDRYMDAMLAHKVSDDLFAREVKFTENGVRLPLGSEGLWFRMSGKGTYKFYVPDVETQQIAYFGTAREKERRRNPHGLPSCCD